MKREKYRAKNGSLRITSTDSKVTTFVILKNHASAPIRKERLSPTSKARREASRNQFVEKGGMPDCRVFNICDIINRTFGSISISNSFKIEATYDNRSDN